MKYVIQSNSISLYVSRYKINKIKCFIIIITFTRKLINKYNYIKVENIK